jgi:hypothetical protein
MTSTIITMMATTARSTPMIVPKLDPLLWVTWTAGTGAAAGWGGVVAAEPGAGGTAAAEGSIGVGSALAVPPLLTWSVHWVPFQ